MLNLEKLQSQLETAVLSTVKEACKAACSHLADQFELLHKREHESQERMRTAEQHAKKTLPENRIQLNIGGQRFCTTRETLLSENDTFFHSLAASEHWKPDDSGEYFIDRDPTQFHHILGYLRQKATAPPDAPLRLESFVDTKKLSEFEKQQLLSDIDFYCMSGMADLLEPGPKPLSNCTVRCSSLRGDRHQGNPADLLGPSELAIGVESSPLFTTWIEFQFETPVTLTRLILTTSAARCESMSDFTVTGQSDRFHHDWTAENREADFRFEVPSAPSTCIRLSFRREFSLTRVQLFGYGLAL
eukprot:TRINITY_DN67879_c0_g1_i4.p1 TRINITY_DN67879_c0_g1~~TRINITY_DN67879_c0_g1_i4.p1  ORF type:complete len:302 (-),score=26.14 TRINITY_DN67879_c0_g1_i4:82-987(-)